MLEIAVDKALLWSNHKLIGYSKVPRLRLAKEEKRVLLGGCLDDELKRELISITPGPKPNI